SIPPDEDASLDPGASRPLGLTPRARRPTRGHALQRLLHDTERGEWPAPAARRAPRRQRPVPLEEARARLRKGVRGPRCDLRLPTLPGGSRVSQRKLLAMEERVGARRALALRAGRRRGRDVRDRSRPRLCVRLQRRRDLPRLLRAPRSEAI